MADTAATQAERRRRIQRMVDASAEDDKDLLDSLRGTDWQRTRGDEVAMMLELALAFPQPAASELDYPLFPGR